MKRITEKDLQNRVDYLNQLTGMPMSSYTKDKTGKYTANEGNYHIDGAYGGYKLVRMDNKGGGISEPIGGGFYPRRELLDKINAYISGIMESKQCNGLGD